MDSHNLSGNSSLLDGDRNDANDGDSDVKNGLFSVQMSARGESAGSSVAFAQQQALQQAWTAFYQMRDLVVTLSGGAARFPPETNVTSRHGRQTADASMSTDMEMSVAVDASSSAPSDAPVVRDGFLEQSTSVSGRRPLDISEYPTVITNYVDKSVGTEAEPAASPNRKHGTAETEFVRKFRKQHPRALEILTKKESNTEHQNTRYGLVKFPSAEDADAAYNDDAFWCGLSVDQLMTLKIKEAQTNGWYLMVQKPGADEEESDDARSSEEVDEGQSSQKKSGLEGGNVAVPELEWKTETTPSESMDTSGEHEDENDIQEVVQTRDTESQKEETKEDMEETVGELKEDHSTRSDNPVTVNDALGDRFGSISSTEADPPSPESSEATTSNAADEAVQVSEGQSGGGKIRWPKNTLLNHGKHLRVTSTHTTQHLVKFEPSENKMTSAMLSPRNSPDPSAREPLETSQTERGRGRPKKPSTAAKNPSGARPKRKASLEPDAPTKSPKLAKTKTPKKSLPKESQKDDNKKSKKKEFKKRGSTRGAGGNGPNIYTVQEILGECWGEGKTWYLVRWDGYSLQDCTWEEAKNVSKSDWAIGEFNKKYGTCSMSRLRILSDEGQKFVEWESRGEKGQI